MSNKALAKLGLDKDAAQKIIDGMPEISGPVYWHRDIHLYYTPGRRKNAILYCEQIEDWRTATRYNSELENGDLFIPISLLRTLVSK